jgi:hypothetical protein
LNYSENPSGKTDPRHPSAIRTAVYDQDLRPLSHIAMGRVKLFSPERILCKNSTPDSLVNCNKLGIPDVRNLPSGWTGRVTVSVPPILRRNRSRKLSPSLAEGCTHSAPELRRVYYVGTLGARREVLSTEIQSAEPALSERGDTDASSARVLSTERANASARCSACPR